MKLFRPNRPPASGLLVVLGVIASAIIATALLLLFSSLILSVSAILGASLAHAAPPKPCDWSAPGAARYAGDPAQAVENYLDMPPTARAAIRAKMNAKPRQFDAVATITRDEIRSGPDTYTGLRDMHWRGGLCRGPVDRSRWAPAAREAGLIYCAEGHCVIVPAVCGNVARVDRAPRQAAATEADGLQRAAYVPEPAPAADGPQEVGGGGGEPDNGPADSFATRATPARSVLAEDRGPRWPQAPGWSTIGGGGGGIGAPCPSCVPCPVPAVPEPETWALMAAGLGMLAWTRRRGARS